MTLVDISHLLDEMGVHNLRMKSVGYKKRPKWTAECEVNHFSEWFTANGRSFNEAFRNLLSKVGRHLNISIMEKWSDERNAAKKKNLP